MKVLFVFGTRPEAIKLSPLILLMRQDDFFDVRVCVTAQHREMLDQVLKVFGIKPDIDLDLMTRSQSLAAFAARAIETIDGAIKEAQPDLCIVQGDTSTAFAAALAAHYNKVPIAHVEAGLRTHNKYSPFPEEMNRVLVSHLCDLHFAPTELARENLLKENISVKDIAVTGNTVVDALHYINKSLARKDIGIDNKTLRKLIDKEAKFIIVTAHRRESFGEGIASICRAVKRFAERHHEIELLFPVHLNPNIRQPVKAILGTQKNIHQVEPLDYVEFVAALSHCYFVLTDSGGVQEEAPAFGKPVLIMRDTTERPEAVNAGLSKLVGTNEEDIFQALCLLSEDNNEYSKMSGGNNPYGDGLASERIISFLRERV